MAVYQIVHTIDSSKSEKEDTKLSAARALYAELLKYYNTKKTTERSA